MKRLLAMLALLAATSANARHDDLVQVRILDTTSNRELPLYQHQGRNYVPGKPGNRYSVILQNRSGERVLAVLSVDGVNAISGQTAGAEQSGYVLGPWERAEIRGWRKNLRETAEFYFTELPDSYAARTDRPQNVGVVGVAVFRERVYQPLPSPPILREDDGRYRGEDRMKSEAPAAPSASGKALADAPSAGAKSHNEPARAQELGTGHGERRWDPVGTTAFQRRSNRPEQIVSVYYDSVQVLAARGIVPPPRRRYSREPDPFPMSFAPDPRR